jgi:ATP-dependent Clp protease adaptor protein ClpS
MPNTPDIDGGTEVLTESETKLEKPKLFKVLLHNDDFTTMEFVVWILESVFNMPEEQAIQVMLNVHLRGLGVAGIYTYEIAETKVEKTTALAREHEFPLLVTMEEA